MARFRDTYRPSRDIQRLPTPLDELTLDEVGLGFPVQVFLIALSTFPFVGIVVGSYYAANESHYATRSLGRMILVYALLLHFILLCVVCPLAFYLSVS